MEETSKDVLHMKTRVNMNVRIFIPILFVVSGCSNKAVYEQIQNSNRIECGKLPPAQYDECVEKNKKPYDEYERERLESLSA